MARIILFAALPAVAFIAGYFIRGSRLPRQERKELHIRRSLDREIKDLAYRNMVLDQSLSTIIIDEITKAEGQLEQ